MACVCNLCRDSSSMQMLYSFGQMPVAGYLDTNKAAARSAPRYELALALCSKDGLVQQAYTDSRPELISRVYAEYQPTYSMSAVVRSYMNSFLDRAISASALQPGDAAIEIGSNDGGVLELLKARGARPIGWEPALRLADHAKKRGFEVVADYLTIDSAKKFLENHKPVKLILTRHTLEHAFDILDFLRSMEMLLADDGMIVIEVPYLRLQMLHGHFESMTFQHIFFFTVSSLAKALRFAGLEPVDVVFVEMDGGSMVVYARKTLHAIPSRAIEGAIRLESAFELDRPSGFVRFFEQVDITRRVLLDYTTQSASQGFSILAYGAGGKGQSLLNMIGLDARQVPFVIDDVYGNAGRFVPGTDIEVIASTDQRAGKADIMLLTAPTHRHEILRKESRRFAEGTQFLITVPGAYYSSVESL